MLSVYVCNDGEGRNKRNVTMAASQRIANMWRMAMYQQWQCVAVVMAYVSS